jgi:heme-degrading monooxygenase HmoA
VHVRVWEFEVREGAEAAFEDLYGPSGGWARLMERADGYRGTELLRGDGGRGRYVTLDRWTSGGDHARFLGTFREAFAELDARGEELTTRETFLGSFETVEPLEP